MKRAEGERREGKGSNRSSSRDCRFLFLPFAPSRRSCNQREQVLGEESPKEGRMLIVEIIEGVKDFERRRDTGNVKGVTTKGKWKAAGDGVAARGSPSN